MNSRNTFVGQVEEILVEMNPTSTSVDSVVEFDYKKNSASMCIGPVEETVEEMNPTSSSVDSMESVDSMNSSNMSVGPVVEIVVERNLTNTSVDSVVNQTNVLPITKREFMQVEEMNPTNISIDPVVESVHPMSSESTFVGDVDEIGHRMNSESTAIGPDEENVEEMNHISTSVDSVVESVERMNSESTFVGPIEEIVEEMNSTNVSVDSVVESVHRMNSESTYVGPVDKIVEEMNPTYTSVDSVFESVHRMKSESTSIGPIEEDVEGVNPTSTSVDSAVKLVYRMNSSSTFVGPIEEIVEELNPTSTSVDSAVDMVHRMKPASTFVGPIASNTNNSGIMHIDEMNPERSVVPFGKFSTVITKLEEETESRQIESIDDINPIRQPEERKHSTTSPDNRNRPYGDLLENRTHYNQICVPLYKASIKGDWKAAKSIFDTQPHINLLAYAINKNYDTVLHVVASCKTNKAVETFARRVVIRMNREQLELRNDNGNTALCLAATAGNLEIARIILCMNEYLVEVPGRKGALPLYMASLIGDKKMVEYLYYLSRDKPSFQGLEIRGSIFLRCLEADIFDVALNMLYGDPLHISNTLIVMARKRDALKGIKPCFTWRIIQRIFAVIDVKVGPAEKPSDAMKVLRIILETIMDQPKDIIDLNFIGRQDESTTKEKEDVRQLLKKLPDRLIALWKKENGSGDVDDSSGPTKNSTNVLFVAVEMGNIEFLIEAIRLYPDLLSSVNDDNQTIFHVAVIHRHVDIYNLVHEIGSMKDMITPLKDKEGNNMLHLVGKCPKLNRLQNDTGDGLQMQHELLWFKEVEALLPPSYREKKNNDGLTPHELFMVEHKDLLSANEKWMKDTANQCLVVAALIASVAFASAFGVPGGYNQNTGIPMFLHNQSFIVFAISDAISLAFSCMSILIFLSIFISRYSELDFLVSLPTKLMAGLATLFFSITAMLVAFTVSFFAIFRGKLIWVPITITMLLLVPIILYGRLQINLLNDVYHSTFGSKLIFRPKRHRLF